MMQKTSLLFPTEKGLLLVIVFLATGSFASAQTTFQRTYGGAGDDFAYHALVVNNGYLIAGSTTSFTPGNSDGYLLRIDAAGNVLWQYAYGGIGDDYFYLATVANDGGFLLAGTTESSGQGDLDAWIVKTDMNGTVQWSKTMGGIGTEKVTLFAQIVNLPNGYLISGSEESITNGTQSSFMLRLDNSGATVWSRYHLTDSGNQFIAGHVEGDTIFAGGAVNTQACLVKLSLATGNTYAINLYAGAELEALYFLRSTPDGNLVMADHTWSTSGSKHDLWVQKVAKNGTVLWSRVYSDPAESLRGSVQVIPEGGYLIVPFQTSGNASGDAVLARLDDAGNIVWGYRYGGSEYDRFVDVKVAGSDGFVAAGFTRSAGAGGYDVLVVRTDTSGLVTGCCRQTAELQVTEYPAITDNAMATSGAFALTTDWPRTANAAPGSMLSYCHTSAPTSDTLIEYCINIPFVLDGIAYTAPDTILRVRPGGAGSCDTVQTIVLGALPVPVEQVQLTACAGDTIFVDGHSYTAPDTTIVVTEIAGNGCDSLIYYQLSFYAYVPATRTVRFCQGLPVTINGINYSEPGMVLDTIAADAGCDTLLTINLLPHQSSSSFLPADTTVCSGTPVQLTSPYPLTYWQPGTTPAASLTVDRPGRYIARVIDGNGCPAADTVDVAWCCGRSNTFVPNVFSPNGDGFNDEFCAVVAGACSATRLEIYDRWGELLFRSAEGGICWDGTYRGKLAPPGVYVWILQLEENGQRDAPPLRGDVTLIR